MKYMKRRMMSLLLAGTLALGMVPMTASAAALPGQNLMLTSEKSASNTNLELGKEINFSLESADEEKSFTFTAAEDGDYIIYFRKLSTDTISLGFTPGLEETQYNYSEKEFQGHRASLKAGGSVCLTFGVAEGCSTYDGTVGAAKVPTLFGGFDTTAKFESDDLHFRNSIQEGQAGYLFCINDPLNYGTEWSVSVDDEGVLMVKSDIAENGGVTYNPVFELKGLGRTSFTITAEYGDESVSQTYSIEVVDDESAGGNGGEGTELFTFDSFDSLKKLVDGKDDSNEETWQYNGAGTLVIAENITIPKHVELVTEEYDIEVKSGANLTVEGCYLGCEDFTVDGTAHLKESLIVNGVLTVNGTLIVDENVDIANELYIGDDGRLHVKKYNLNMQYPAIVSGIERIQFAEDWQNLYIHVPYKNAGELQNLADTLRREHINHERVVYGLEYQWTDLNETLTLDRDVTIPEYVELKLRDIAGYTIASGKTLTINGWLNIDSPVTVNGALKNNKYVDVRRNSHDNGKLIIPVGGSYEGSGDFWVHGALDQTNLNNIFVYHKPIGDDFDIHSSMDDDGNPHWQLKYAGNLIKLATPKNLTWGTWYMEELEWDEQAQTGIIAGYTKVKKQGYISWETDRPDQARAEVKIYRKGETTPCHECSMGFGTEEEPKYRSEDAFLLSDLGSGTYYFTVQSMGDYKEYRDSDVAVSGYYTYKQPSKQLSLCTDLSWEDKGQGFVSWAFWEAPSKNAKYIDGYQVDYFYSPTENGDYQHVGGVMGRSYNPQVLEPLHDHFLQNGGTGYYKFKVRALSGDITKCRNAEWSDFSPVLDMENLPKDVTNDLDDILNNSSNIKDDVQAMDTTDLKAALLTDQNNTGATQILKNLEIAAAGKTAGIVITPDATAFVASDVTIVGANLNKDDNSGDSITLVVDKPEKQHVIEERYNSSVAVRFSMTLDNAADPKNLEVPVKITLPVPDSINAEFLVVLHYHTDGTHERIWPYVYENNGKLYADFVVTSFSDFIMTELADLNTGTNSGGGSSHDDGDDEQTEAAPVNTVITVTSAPTADTNNSFLWTVLALFSGCAVTLFGNKKRRYKTFCE